MNTELLLAWWNLIYVVPFLLAVVYLGVYAVSGLTFGEHDIDHDADAHLEGDLHADAEVHPTVDADGDLHGESDFHGEAEPEADHDLSADADHDADRDAEADGGQDSQAVAAHAPRVGSTAGEQVAALDAPLYLRALSWLGLGRVPMSIVLMVLFLTWGALGFVTNRIVEPALPWAALALLASLPVAGLGSLGITRVVVRTMGRWLPTNETSAESQAKLVGLTGEALYDIDKNFGLIAVRDRRGDLFQVPGRVYDHKPPIAKGTKVLLVDYAADEKHFYVTVYDLDH